MNTMFFIQPSNRGGIEFACLCGDAMRPGNVFNIKNITDSDEDDKGNYAT